MLQNDSRIFDCIKNVNGRLKSALRHSIVLVESLQRSDFLINIIYRVSGVSGFADG